MAQLKQIFILRLGQCISLLMFISSITSRFCNSDCLNALIVNFLAFAYIFHNSLRGISRVFLWLHDNVKQDLVISIQWYWKYMQSEQQKGIFLLVSNWQCLRNFWCGESSDLAVLRRHFRTYKSKSVWFWGGGGLCFSWDVFQRSFMFFTCTVTNLSSAFNEELIPMEPAVLEEWRWLAVSYLKLYKGLKCGSILE